MRRPSLPSWRHRRPRCVLALAWALAGTACTTLPGPPLVRDEGGCHAWVAALDAAITSAGVGDAEAERIDGAAGLRVDRLTEALASGALAGEAAWAAWLDRAAALDRDARRAEIGNLPAHAFPLGPAADAAADRQAASARTDRCRDSTVRQLRGEEAPAAIAPPPPQPRPEPPKQQPQPGAGTEARRLREALVERARVPDRYSAASRTLGLYPLLRWPFFAGVQRWQADHEAAMQRWAAAPPPLRRTLPAPGPDAAAEPPPLPARRDALGLPRLAPHERQRLLAWHAPVFEIEERGAFDRFGAPQWASAEATVPQVDVAQPLVYTRIAHTRLEGRWLLQLVYTLWFPERPARSAIDLLAGALDGVIVRLTLDEAGEPLLMDTIHACGCYHLFFPSPALRPRGQAPRREEWQFAPATLPPAVGRDARLVVQLASGTHYVTGLAEWPRQPPGGPPVAEASARSYALRDEHELRSLPLPPAGTERRSLYGPAGLVAGSERGERFLFWPMGIASAGAMRQWGHHATAFVGRRHFDEADLIERRFERAAVSPPQP